MTDVMQPQPILLDCHAAAAVLGVSLRKFRDLMKGEGFPAGRTLGPRSTRWHRDELAAFAANLPAAKNAEPASLAAARAARKAGKVPAPAAHAPFPAAPAPKQPWGHIR